MRTYAVKEVFGPTLQGEGLHAGMPCLFVRLAGCNAWEGRLETRAASACPYCDTDFRGGEALSSAAIMQRLTALLPEGYSAEIGCVLTGGEPLLQADEALLHELGAAFAWVDIETNGTRACPAKPANVFISCSPKRITDQPIVVTPSWWKILIPDQAHFLEPAEASGLPIFVQPTCPDGGPQGDVYQANLNHCLELCYTKGFRLSLQQHKYLSIR
jgi:organic radical activating enzyme